MGFEWNTFYLNFETKMKAAYPGCTVGRYVTPKKTKFPYVDVTLGDNTGGDYELSGNEGSQHPLIVISVYNTGSAADGICNDISQKAKKIMLSYGFQCRGGPVPVVNATDPNISRWVGRYQRLFGCEDVLKEIK